MLINTSGGLAEGDTLRQRLAWETDSRGVITTQAAEKVYRALAHGCTIETRIDVARGAEAEWLPQETILFDRARLRRNTCVNLDADSSFLGVEAIVLGRTAMDERMREGMLRDSIRISRGGRLIYADVLDLRSAIDGLMAHRTIGNGGCAMAVLLHVAAKAAVALDSLREALAGAASLAAASCWNGMLAARLVAPDGVIRSPKFGAGPATSQRGRPQAGPAEIRTWSRRCRPNRRSVRRPWSGPHTRAR